MGIHHHLKAAAAGAAILSAALSVRAAGFVSPLDLVVVRIDKVANTNAEAVHLDEIAVGGPAIQAPLFTVNLPSTGANAFTLTNTSNHDGHLHLSTNGQFLTLGGYNADAGVIDPSTLASATNPRVIAVIGANGIPDLTTRLTDTFNQTGIRAVSSTDGQHFWVAGDNFGGTGPDSLTGGLRYVGALGASSSVNISQVQVLGGAKTPDNVRDVGIFGGGLYDSSGSSASIGKAVFSVSATLPTSGVQTLSTLSTDGASLSSFTALDIDPTTPGIDTIYGVQDGGINKYNLIAGIWVAKGTLAVPAGTAETIAARRDVAGGVDLYLGTNDNIYAAVDGSAFGANISGALAAIYTAPAGSQFRGLDFVPSATPVPEPASLALVAVASMSLLARRRR